MSESTYAWRISRDMLFGDSKHSDAGVEGPRNAPESLLAVLRQPVKNADRVHAFRMLDDDGILYYTGHIMAVEGVSPWAMDEEAAFGPLDDFGRPNAGAVYIQYRNAAGEWEGI